MAVLVWTEIVCGSCAEQSPGQYASGPLPRRDLWSNAKKHGWVRKGDEAFCSEECREQWIEQNDQGPT